MILIYNDDSDDDDVIVMIVGDCYDELLCHRIRNTMMMIMMYGLLVCIFLCVDRY